MTTAMLITKKSNRCNRCGHGTKWYGDHRKCESCGRTMEITFSAPASGSMFRMMHEGRVILNRSGNLRQAKVVPAP